MLELDPDHINAAYARGACENKRGNFAAAIEDYNMALEKDQGVGSINDPSPTSAANRRFRHRNINNYLLDDNSNRDTQSFSNPQSQHTPTSKQKQPRSKLEIETFKERNMERQKNLWSPAGGSRTINSESIE